MSATVDIDVVQPQVSGRSGRLLARVRRPGRIGVVVALVASCLVGAGVAVPQASAIGGLTGTSQSVPSDDDATVHWSGRGLTTEAGRQVFSNLRCDPSNAPFVRLVLSGVTATSASVQVGSAAPVPMVRKARSWRYTYRSSTLISPAALLESPVVATHDGETGGELWVKSACPGPRRPTASVTIGTPVPSTGVVVGSVTGANADRLTFTYALVTMTRHGAVAINSSTGRFVYRPTAAARHAAAGPGPTEESFTVSIDDGRGGRTDVDVVVPISPTNSAPTASATSSRPLTVGGVVNGSVIGSDADGDTLTYRLTSPPSGGSVRLGRRTGVFIYTPTPRSRTSPPEQSDSFTVTVRDGHGGAVDQRVTVRLTPNNAPSASPEVGTPDPASGIVSGSVGAADADADTLSYSVTTNPSSGTATVAPGGSYVYTPTAAARHAAARRDSTTDSNSDSFVVTVRDGHGGVIDVTVTVPILPANTAPTASTTVLPPDVATGVVTGSVDATDADGDTLTYLSDTPPLWGTVVVEADGTFTYTPTEQARGAAAQGGATSDAFDITVDDDHGGVIDVSVDVTIGASSNSAPVVTGPVTGDATEDGAAVDLDPLANSSDPDAGTTLSVTNVGTLPDGVTFDEEAGLFTLDPTDESFQSLAAGDTTTVSVEFDVSDGTATTAASVSWTVTGVSAALTASVSVDSPPDSSTGEVTGSVDATDPSGRVLSFSSPSTSTGGGSVSVDAASGSFTYTPTLVQRQAAGLSTTDTFTITISNGVESITETVTVPVDPGTPVEGAPTVGSPDGDTGVVTGSVSFTDTAGRSLTFSGPSTSTGGGSVSIDAVSGSFTYTPTVQLRQAAGLDTTDTFTVTASNGLRTATQTVTVPVDPGTPVEGTPTVSSPSSDTGVVTGSVSFTDTASRSLTFSGPSTSTGGGSVSIDAVLGSFTYTPTVQLRQAAGLDTTDTFTVTASNGLRTATQTITVSVDPGAPTAGTPVVGAPADFSVGRFVNTGLYSRNGLASSTVNGIFVAGTKVYAATSSGLSISTDSGSTWVSRTISHGLGSNSTNGVWASGNSVYVATNSGLSVSTDGGSTFTNRTAVANGLGNTTVYGVYGVSATAGTTIYAATAYGLSISSDDGATFDNRVFGNAGLGSIGNSSINGVYVDTDGTIYAATNAGVGVSTDGGRSFAMKTITQSNTVYAVYAKDGVIYAGTSAGTSVSSNGGSTWTMRASATGGLGNGNVRSILATSTTTGTTIYAGTTSGVSISTDGGANYTTTATSSGVRGLALSGSTLFVATNGAGVGISTDSGVNYVTPIATGLGSNTVYAVYDDGTTLYATTSGGLSKSTDGGSTWTNTTLSGGTTTTAIAVNGTTMRLATGSKGLATSTDGGQTFTYQGLAQGLGSDIARDVAVDGSTIYVATSNGLSISTDGGTSWTTKTTSNTTGLPGNSITAVAVSGSTIYLGTTSGVGISRNGGSSFTAYTTASGSGLGSNAVPNQGLEVVGDTVYVATGNGLAISTDGGNSYTNRQTASGLGSNTVTTVYVNDGTIYAGTNGGLSISTDGGVSFTNYTPASSGLAGPAVSNGAILVRGAKLYVGTANGLSIGTITVAGTVTGSATFTHPAARTLTYSAPATSAGGGTVTLDSTTGAFVYTPTRAQRAAATADTTDTFVVTASDGVKTATQTITVSVSPA